jgi:ATP-dependent DNA ligase
MREICTSGSDRGAARRLPSLPDLKRYRSIDCIVIGVAGDLATPRLVLGLMHSDNLAHHLGVTRALHPTGLEPLSPLVHQLGPEEPAIRSRWQHDAVPPWRRLPPELICEIQATTIDGHRWLRQPANVYSLAAGPHAGGLLARPVAPVARSQRLLSSK